MKNAKIKFWKRFKILFALILLVAGIMAFGSIFDFETGLALAAVAPIVWIKGGKFTQELTEGELKKLSDEDYQIYIKELNESKQAMRDKQIEDLKAELIKETKGLISKEEFEELKAKINDLDLEATLKQFNDVLEGLKKTPKDAEGKEGGFHFALKEAHETIKSKFEKNPDLKDMSLRIKALPLTSATWSGSTNYPFLQDDQEPGAAKAPRTPLTFVNDVPTLAPISPNKDKWTWIERGTITDGTNTSIAEAGAFGSVEVAFSKKEADVEKIGNYTKMTREMVEDWNEFQMAVNELLDELLLESLNDDLSTYIQSVAAEFDANGITESAPTIWDVIRVTIAQIVSSGKTKWMPNKIYMNPVDVAEQDIKKDSDGNYVFPPFMMPNGMVVKGITISETTDVAEGYFEVADITKIGKRFKREIELRLWEQNATDVQNDLLTMTGSLRYAKRIKTVDYNAFVYDSFDAAEAILKGAAASLTLIQGMATNSDASKLTINLLVAAGVTGTSAASLADYKVAVAAESSIADLAALQTVIDGA
jgi:hypothetical protein